jgi:hypothetical protein
MSKRCNKRSTRVNTGRKRPTLASLYEGTTKQGLIEMLCEPECTVEEVMSLAKLSRAALVVLVEEAKKRALRYSQEPCPKGHKPGDPDCDISCFITNITPMSNEFTTSLPKVVYTTPMFEWLIDPISKRHWWERIPYSFGWWWRVPYGWWLSKRTTKR